MEVVPLVGVRSEIDGPTLDDVLKGNKHVPRPPLFNGKDFDIFHGAVLAYMRANPKYFQSYVRRRDFILGYCQSGEALSWKNNYLRDVKTNAGDDDFDFDFEPRTGKTVKPPDKQKDNFTKADWREFVGSLKQRFDHYANHETIARDKVENFKQGRLSLSRYLDQFKQWIREACWDEPQYEPIILRYLERNIDPSLSEKVYLEPTLPTTVDEWVQLATKWDTRKQAHRLATGQRTFHTPAPNYSNHRSPSPSPTPRSPSPTPQRSQTPFHPRAITVQSHSRSPSPNRPKISDADFQDARKKGICAWCKKEWSNDHKCAERTKFLGKVRSVIAGLPEEDRAELLDSASLDFSSGRK